MFRENSDLVNDEETVHVIKKIHLPVSSGSHYDSNGQETDFALVELDQSVNVCSPRETSDGRCWRVTPVRLPDPFIYIQPGAGGQDFG